MVLRRRRPPTATRARGFALILLMALVTLGVLYFVTVQLEAVGLYQREARQQGGGGAALEQAREALLAYAATYRDNNANEVFGYLPCPDTTGDGIADTVLNAAECGSSGHASVGLLPYRTLGLPDLRDGDGNCLWYAVSGAFKAALTKPTPVNWDTQGQFKVVDLNGAILVAPDDSQGGAAALIFSTGGPLAGQNRTASASGPCKVDPSQVAAYLDANYTFAATGTITLNQGPQQDANGTFTNNDRLVWISPKEIFDRVIARKDFGNALNATPPGQINTLIDRLAKALDKKVQDDIFNGTSTSQPTNTASYTPQPAAAAMGDVDATTDIGLANAPSYANYLTNWADQFRQIRCNSVSTACLDVNNGGTANCRGALLFSGRNGAGQPRASAQKVPSVANLDYYFEAAGRAFLKGTSTSFSGNIAYSGASSDADIAACLGYGTYDSLKQSSPAFSAGTIAPAGAATGVATVTGVGGPSPTIVLGSTIAVARAGCVWNANKLPLNTSLRLYYTYAFDSTQTSTTPRGYVLALADAATNNVYSNDPVMCGASGSNRLGYAGAPVSGSATVGGSSANITGNSWSPLSGGRVTITTAAPHGFASGDTVTIANASPSGYNGTYTINSIIGLPATSTQFRYLLATDPGLPYMGIFPPKVALEFDTYCDVARGDPPAGCPSPVADHHHFAFMYWGGVSDNTPSSAIARNGNDDNTHGSGVAADGAQPLNPGNLSVTAATATPFATVAAAQWSGGTATITTAAPHGYATGQSVTIADFNPLGYKGTVTVTVTDATHFTYPLVADPGRYPYVATVSAASWAAGTGTVTSSAAHGLATGNTVILSGMSPAAWNGSYSVTVTDATHFTVAIAGNPGAYVSGGRASAPLSFISAASWSGGRVSVTTAASHGLVSDQYVTISGASPAGYNGTYRITVTSGTQFSYFLSGSPGFYTSGGDIAVAGATSTVMASPVAAASVSGADWASNAVTVTTGAAHGLATGQMVQVAGVYPVGYNGVYSVTVIDATHFSYALASDPGGTFTASTFGYPGIATIKVSDPFLPYAKTPLDTTIHVRLDITRSYDATRHQAVLTLKGYVGDTFALVGNCGQADFQNLARDLSELCPVRTPTIEQDGITVNDAAGPALANIYLGFTTARSASAGDNEIINIRNLILRSQ